MIRLEDEEKRPDLLLLGVVVILLILGLLAVYSSSFAVGIIEFGDPSYFIVRQGIWAALGAVLLVVFMRLDYHLLKNISPVLMLVALGTLAAILVPGLGLETYGAQRWLRLGPLPPVQPSEFVKLALIIYVAAWLSSRGERLRQFSRGVIPFVLMVGLVGGLILLQPDFGTAVVIVIISLTMFFIAGADLKHLFLLAGTAAVAAVPLIIKASYRADRLQSFLDPWQDPQGKGFHIIQSLIALGSGGLTGLGLGASRQKFLYVPGSHTDAIYAIIGEELGLLGALLVLILLAALGYRGFKIAMEAREDFGALLSVGIITWLLVQAFINIGGITKTIPFTGIPLPLVSYGGSSLAAVMAATGVLLSVSRYRGKADKEQRPAIAYSGKTQ